MQPQVAMALANVFKDKTGADWGTLTPGDRALPGKYWLQQQANPDLSAKWEYYVSDGVDGKKTGWYPYVRSASDEVEELYAQHVANAREDRTATRLISSGHFSYSVDLTQMTQQNTRTKKVRTIRRATGKEEGSMSGPTGKAMKKHKASVSTPRRSMKLAMKGSSMKLAMKAMKVKKTMKKAMKKSKIGSYAQVLKGLKLKTKGGLPAGALMKNKNGKVVSRKQHAHGQKKYEVNLAKWVNACIAARKELGLTGFVAVRKGSEFYNRAKALSSS